MQKISVEELKGAVARSVDEVRATTPLVPSITNMVTVNFVANAQLAVGGSAAMIYLPDEAESIAAVCNSFYINMGTLFPVYAETLPRVARALNRAHKPWALDPVGIGIGSLRANLLLDFKHTPPSIIRGNASEIIALAALWELDCGNRKSGVRGVDSTDSVADARAAAVALARATGGAVAVSGPSDLITDGFNTVFSDGGSPMCCSVTGAGCSLGGVCATYLSVASPLIAAVTACAMYNEASERAFKNSKGPGSFQVDFIDNLYNLKGSEVAMNSLRVEYED